MRQSEQDFDAYVCDYLNATPDLSDATVILIFAQPVSADAARKRLAYQPQTNRLTIQRLNERVRQTAEATSLPVLRSADLITHTGTFGEQLTAALQATFALGFERVLVVGNDCPALTTAHLTLAAERLQSESVVLGPDQRGGLYLLGLSRNAFDPALLVALPWQTGRLWGAVRRVYANQFVSYLPQSGDVNNRADLRQYRATSSTVASFIAQLLKLGTADQAAVHHCSSTRLIGVYVRTGSLRAPPALRAISLIA